ncbi:MAG: condensation domain-containing protein, partial [Pyrinomonadaceae bacterium]
MTETLILTTALKEERDYWLSRLSGELGGGDLPTDFKRSKVYSAKRGEVAIPLPEDLGRRLLAFAKDSSFLTYTTLMAALKVCLHKYTGAGLVVVGSPPYRQAEAPPQPPNVLAVADHVEDAESFRGLLVKVRENLTGGYARQGYPFAQLVKDLGLEAAENRCPLFDVVLVLADIHGELPALKNDLTFTFDRTGGGVEGRVAFNARLFKRETVERLAGHFVNVLRGALDDSSAPVSRLSLLGEDEREQIVRGWNDTREDYPRDACLHQLFEEQAARTPDAVALVF